MSEGVNPILTDGHWDGQFFIRKKCWMNLTVICQSDVTYGDPENNIVDSCFDHREGRKLLIRSDRILNLNRTLSDIPVSSKKLLDIVKNEIKTSIPESDDEIDTMELSIQKDIIWKKDRGNTNIIDSSRKISSVLQNEIKTVKADSSDKINSNRVLTEDITSKHTHNSIKFNDSESIIVSGRVSEVPLLNSVIISSEETMIKLYCDKGFPYVFRILDKITVRGKYSNDTFIIEDSGYIFIEPVPDPDQFLNMIEEFGIDADKKTDFMFYLEDYFGINSGTHKHFGPLFHPHSHIYDRITKICQRKEETDVPLSSVNSQPINKNINSDKKLNFIKYMVTRGFELNDMFEFLRLWGDSEIRALTLMGVKYRSGKKKSSDSDRKKFILGSSKSPSETAKDIYMNCIINPFSALQLDIDTCKIIWERMGREYSDDQLSRALLARTINTDNKENKNTGTSRNKLILEAPRYEILEPDFSKDNYRIIPDKHQNTVYIEYPYKVERKVSEIICRLISSPSYSQKFDIVKSSLFDLDTDQEEAVRGSISNNISLITGGGGTGKSTIIHEIVHNLKRMKITYAVLGFTGKSVYRIKSILKDERPKTLDYMYYKYYKTEKDLNPEFCLISRANNIEDDNIEDDNSNTELRGRDYGNEFECLVIDEISMVTTELLYRTFKACPNIKKLILVGDPHQLQPIDWGDFLNQFIMSKKIQVFGLSKNYRSIEIEENGGINTLAKFSKKIIEYKDPAKNFPEGENFYDNDDLGKGNFLKISPIVWNNRPNAVITAKSVLEILKYKYGYDSNKILSMTIICPGDENRKGINKFCSELYNSDSEKTTDENGGVWRVGDKIMMLKNDHEMNVMNGQEGVITETCKIIYSVAYGGHTEKLEMRGVNVKFENCNYKFNLEPLKTLTKKNEMIAKFKMMGPSLSRKSEEDTSQDDAMGGGKISEDLGNPNSLNIMKNAILKDKDELKNVTNSYRNMCLSYSMTPHKAQGSEWDVVIVCIPFSGEHITSNYIYTSITRAKKQLILIGEDKILNGVSLRRPQYRHDKLTERIRHGCKNIKDTVSYLCKYIEPQMVGP